MKWKCSDFQTGPKPNGLRRPLKSVAINKLISCGLRRPMLETPRNNFPEAHSLAYYPNNRLIRYVRGDTPVSRRNARAKFDASVYPSVAAISATGLSDTLNRPWPSASCSRQPAPCSWLPPQPSAVGACVDSRPPPDRLAMLDLVLRNIPNACSHLAANSRCPAG